MGRKTHLVCNCEKTMELDGAKIAKALDLDGLKVHTHLCRTELSEFENALAKSDDILVACTQEAPLFAEITDEAEFSGKLKFVNIRENAGWCEKKKKTNAKVAALLAAATYEATPAPLKSVKSDGLCLVYGAGQAAFEMATILSRSLSVTLLLSDPADVSLPTVLDVPIYRGRIKSARGSFGRFEVNVDGYAAMLPSSRGELQFAMARDGVVSNCSLIFDMSGETPLLTGHEKRDGYFRADPDDRAKLMLLAIDAGEMVGEFEKPIYVKYSADICAHSRSQITGCTNCLDLCPAGAITEDGDGVLIDTGICGGCGSCHASCPTGAVSYAYPSRNDFIARSQLLLKSYSKAGGKDAVILIHDEKFGNEIISIAARFGSGLLPNVLPVVVHAITNVGHVELGALLASGASQIVLLADPAKNDELDGLKNELELLQAILKGFGDELSDRIKLLAEYDPEKFENALNTLGKRGKLPSQTFTPTGSKRDIARSTFAALRKATRSKVEYIELPEKAPYGSIEINLETCTLCMSCVSACPAEAVIDTPGEPRLRFIESACVQCGLCVNTCPENALSLSPGLNLMPDAMQPVTLKEEEPFCCVKCGEAFATKSTITRISEQLAGKHSMFQDEARSQLIKMCDNCRVESQANSKDDPFTLGERPKVRTTQDYIDAEDAGLSIEDFLIKD